MRIGDAVCERISILAKERRVTINRLCTICGVPQSTVNNIFTSKHKDVRLSTIAKICEGLEITIIEFFNHPVFENLDPYE